MGHPIIYHPPSTLQNFHSSAHCIGDNFDEKDSWKSKTCQFQNLCFDMSTHDFVVFASPEQVQLEKVLSDQSLTYFSASTSLNDTYVSIGGINDKWARDIQRMRWFPKQIDVDNVFAPYESEKEGGVYMLPPDVVLFPFHSLAGMNVGHLVWDDWLPLYSTLENFDFLDRKPLFVRYILETKLWGSCDLERNVKMCAKMMSKFLPLLGVGDSSTKGMNQLYTVNEWGFSPGEDPEKRSRYVCGKNGLAGLGMATDHGQKLHGWGPKDYQSSHNTNRGAQLYRFRNFMMENIGVSTAPLQNMGGKKAKFKILFSVDSSSIGNRKTRFDKHFSSLQKSSLKEKYDLDIQRSYLPDLNLVEQVELVSTTSIYITVCGGGAVSATFLPKGAALFIFFHEEEGTGKTPARLDWDYFNHISYVRTHWLPRMKKTVKMAGSATGPLEVDFEAFVRLIDHELDIISHL